MIAPRATGDGSCPIHHPGNEDVIASELTPRTFLGSGKTSLFVRVANWEALMCKLQSSSCWKYLPPIDTEFGSALRRQMRRVLFSTLPPHLDFAILPPISLCLVLICQRHNCLSLKSPMTLLLLFHLDFQDYYENLHFDAIIFETVYLLSESLVIVNRVSKIIVPAVNVLHSYLHIFQLPAEVTDGWTVDWMGRAERQMLLV